MNLHRPTVVASRASFAHGWMYRRSSTLVQGRRLHLKAKFESSLSYSGFKRCKSRKASAGSTVETLGQLGVNLHRPTLAPCTTARSIAAALEGRRLTVESKV